ncbi:MAG: hypothetical protein H7Y36_12090 [Armatimonadetes bacterium]|nr:hypothetical protein [Akkermansiaceae bacterium]
MKPTIQQIGDLLALKRSERPDESYWQDFLCEFHQNQREQAVKQSEIAHFFGRVSGWFSEMGPSKWAYGAGLAYAAVTVAFFLTPRDVVKENTPVSPVNYQVVPAATPPAVEQLNQLDLSPTTQGNVGEQVF